MSIYILQPSETCSLLSCNMHHYKHPLAVNFTETDDKNKVIIFWGDPFGGSAAAFEKCSTERPVMNSKLTNKQFGIKT